MGIVNRLKEPSTWASLAALVALSGMQVPDDVVQAMPGLVGFVAAVLGVFLKEKASD